MVKLDMTSKQAAVNKFYHMNNRNDRWLMRLKLIQEEYYSIENQKS